MSMVKSNKLLASPGSLSFYPIIQAHTQTSFVLDSVLELFLVYVHTMARPLGVICIPVIYFYVRTHYPNIFL